MDPYEYDYENSHTVSSWCGRFPTFASSLFRSKIRVLSSDCDPFGYDVAVNYGLIYDTK